MNPASPHLPAIVGKVISRLPLYPGSLFFVAGLNAALARYLPEDITTALEGRPLRIHVTDAGITVDFSYTHDGFKAARHADAVDLTIAASAYDFLRLMQGEEDPDTLFFSRRLVMEGDTELGLMVKNTLDALDMSELSISRFLPVIKKLQHALW